MLFQFSTAVASEGTSCPTATAAHIRVGGYSPVRHHGQRAMQRLKLFWTGHFGSGVCYLHDQREKKTSEQPGQESFLFIKVKKIWRNSPGLPHLGNTNAMEPERSPATERGARPAMCYNRCLAWCTRVAGRECAADAKPVMSRRKQH